MRRPRRRGRMIDRFATGALLLLAVAAGADEAPPAPAPPAPSALRVDPGARMLEGGGAGESWDVSARLEDGSHLFVRFWVTNEGPGSHTGVAIGYFAQSDGRVSHVRYGRTRDRWVPQAEGRVLKVASAVLDLRAPYGAVEIDTVKYGMKIVLRFAIPETLSPICARRAPESGFDVLRLQEDVEGIAWVEGMKTAIAAKGSVDISHAWGTRSEIDTILRRIDVSGRDGDLAFFATSTLPPTKGGDSYSCVAVVVGDEIYESQSAALEVVTPQDTGGGYPLPSQVVFGSEELALTVEPGREVLRVNPLDTVPQPFRALLAWRSAPRRVWAEARWQLRVLPGKDREARERRDRGLIAVSYTNPQ